MRIVLDSNIYVSDFRMEGFAFANLFDLVRKTGATIVLPRIVREEVVRKYAERFADDVRAVQKAWKSYRYLMLDNDPGRFREPEVKYQLKALRKRLANPAKDITILYDPDLSAVNLDAVAMRGIKRLPPANEEGEELRDVIIWFQVLALAKRTGQKTIFVTDDGGFWEADSLKPQIALDIQKSESDVVVYRTIEDVVKAHAPTQSPLISETARTLIPAELFWDSVTPKLESAIEADRWSMYDFFNAYGAGLRVASLERLSTSFVQGTIYEINSDVSYITASYDFQAKAVVKLLPQASPSIILGTYPAPQNLVPARFGGLVGWDRAPFSNKAHQGIVTTHGQTWPSWAVEPTPNETTCAAERVAEVIAVARVRVSVRMIEKKILEKAIEEFKLLRIRPSDQRDEIAPCT